MNKPQGHGPDHVEMNTDPAAFAHWPEGLYEEMLQSRDNGCVGSVLVSETPLMRVWHLHIAPGKRCGFHRHVNRYFWTAMVPGKARDTSLPARSGMLSTTKAKRATSIMERATRCCTRLKTSVIPNWFSPPSSLSTGRTRHWQSRMRCAWRHQPPLTNPTRRAVVPTIAGADKGTFTISISDA